MERDIRRANPRARTGSRSSCASSSDCRTRLALTISTHTMSNWGPQNPRATAYRHFKMPLESSKLPGVGPVFPD